MSVSKKPKSLYLEILLFAVPLMLTSILSLFFNTADVVVVGRWGGETPEEREIALAAVGSCSALSNLLTCLFMGLSAGTGVLVSRALGSGEREKISPVMHTTLCLGILCGAFLCAVGVLFAEPLLSLMGTDAEVLPEAGKYMRACFLGTPASIIYNFLAAGMRATKDSVRPLLFISIGGAVNVGLNLLMVLGFGLGALGVGIATASSQWIACILILGYLLRMEGDIKISFKKLRMDTATVRQILAIGLPAGLQAILFNITNVMLQSAINTYGKTAVAGNAAAGNIDCYQYCIQNTLYQASLTFVSYAYGKRSLREVKKSLFACYTWVVVFGISIGWLILLLKRPLLSLFAPGNPEIVEWGIKRFWVICPLYFLCGTMDAGSGALRSIGKSSLATVLSLVFSCVFRIVWIYTVCNIFPNNIYVLYALYPASYILSTVANHLAFEYSLKRDKRFGETLPEVTT